jgi:hypothetical protein
VECIALGYLSRGELATVESSSEALLVPLPGTASLVTPESFRKMQSVERSD